VNFTEGDVGEEADDAQALRRTFSDYDPLLPRWLWRNGEMMNICY
jgi:hypothetical protein